MEGIDVTIERNGTSATVAVVGEIDLTTASALESDVLGLIEGSVTELEIGLGGVSFMDSTGLRVLLKASKLLATAGGTLRLGTPSDPVRRLLEVSGLDTHFEITS